MADSRQDGERVTREGQLNNFQELDHLAQGDCAGPEIRIGERRWIIYLDKQDITPGMEHFSRMR